MSELLIPLLELSSKLLIYLGCSAIIGGFFIVALSRSQGGFVKSLWPYTLVGTVFALLAVGINFFTQVGSFAESGWAGMVDPLYVAMLWDSATGYSVLLRIAALGLVFLLTLLVFSPASDKRSGAPLVMAILGVACLLLAASFSLIGHTAGLPLAIRALLSLHVLIALLWMGSLFPLWKACRMLDIPALQDLMHRFGRVALGLVALLVMCGVVVAYQLLGSVSELVMTNYGLVLLSKIVLVAIILGFAAWHKLKLVPGLTDQQATDRLRHSILLEGLVGIAILGVTVILTTVVGPESMHN